MKLSVTNLKKNSRRFPRSVIQVGFVKLLGQDYGRERGFFRVCHSRFTKMHQALGVSV